MIEGEPVVLARKGKLYEAALKRELVSRADFYEAMREQGCTDIAEVKLALLETNGQISIVAKD